MPSVYSVPQYSIFIHPKQLFKLNQNIYDDETVSARLKIASKTCPIHISYRGHHIRKFKKKSFRVIFQDSTLYKGAKEIHLNSEFKDHSLIRNKLSFDFFHSIGVIAPQAQHVCLMLNGKNQGVYLEIESFDEYFLRKRNIASGPIFYATNNDANFSLLTPEGKLKNSLMDGYTRKSGYESEDEYIKYLIFKVNTLTKEEFRKEIENLIDLDQYFKWLAGVVCIQHFDGFIHNYSLFLNPLTKKFEISPWDCDGTWGRDIHGRTMDLSDVPINGFNTLTARILDDVFFRVQYKEILKHILDNHFTIDILSPIITQLHENIRPYVLQDPYKKQQIEHFDNEPSFICQFISEKNQYLRNRLCLLG
ncbi:CotH kinase family protein [Metabacillus sp. RGM 3146]|uniref:CotH kinase family protein n=1 Tax=Metabacillus sp. RGM 3146 TaxID=3401092 RepID=UPI003B9B499D